MLAKLLATFSTFVIAILASSSSSLYAQTLDPAVERMLSAVVGVFARVPETARTAEVLGTERLGSGVVIGDDGLVVTIGYLMLEASTVSLFVGAEGVRVPARVVGYDAQSGFGLLRAEEPLDVTPMELGDSSTVAKEDPVLVSSFDTRSVSVRPTSFPERSSPASGSICWSNRSSPRRRMSRSAAPRSSAPWGTCSVLAHSPSPASLSASIGYPGTCSFPSMSSNPSWRAFSRRVGRRGRPGPGWGCTPGSATVG